MVDVVSFVCKGQHLLVATTVAIGCQMVRLTVRIARKDTVNLLLSVAIPGEETSCQSAIDDLYLRAQHLHGGEKGLHPVVDGCADNQHFRPFCLGLLQCLHSLRP